MSSEDMQRQMDSKVSWTALSVIVTVLIVGIGWAILASSAASAKAEDVSRNVNALNGTLQGLTSKVDAINSNLNRLLDSQGVRRSN